MTPDSETPWGRATPLASPAALRAAVPPTERAASTVKHARDAIRDALRGRDARLVVVVGPCSIHDPRAALEYARRLAARARELEGSLIVVMRTYLEKSRSGAGWKGLVSDPHLDGSGDIGAGLERARRLLCEINDLGLPCALELVDPLAARYLADLVSWAAVGARSVQSQPHRELASGAPLPVGFKNAPCGDLASACQAIACARQPQHFLGVDELGRAAALRSPGNPDAHLVLRGGASGPNYAASHLDEAALRLRELGLVRPILVDCSHDNSGKDPRRQAAVCRALLDELRTGRREILGFMLESSLRAGRQALVPGERLEYGVSITDGCMGWEETETLLREAARTQVG
jgi:3-deoxy-7-phosphoheptulonate synthase